MIDPITKRVSIALRDYYANAKLADCVLYIFDSEKEDLGFDPWKMADHVEQFKKGDWYNIWFPNNPYPQQVSGDYVVFVSQADAIHAKIPLDKP